MTSFETSSIDLVPRPVKTYHSKTYDRISPLNTTFDAKGKTVLVTAGATGIGYSISKAFAQAGVGRVIIISRRPEPQAQAKAKLQFLFPRTTIDTIACSVTDRANMAQILERAGGIDILVLCAAAGYRTVPSIDQTTEEADHIFETNVVACFDLIKTYLGLPPPASGTRTIINVSSGSAHCYVPGQTLMAASKAAGIEIVSFFAAEHTPEKDGVRLFSIHPGIFYTDNVAENYANDAIEWEDIDLPGNFCVWLASPESDFLHGRFVWAQWDVDELIELKEKFAKHPFFLKIGLLQ